MFGNIPHPLPQPFLSSNSQWPELNLSFLNDLTTASLLKFWELSLIWCVQAWMAHPMVTECQTQDGDYCPKANTMFYLLGKLSLKLLLIQDIWSNRPNPAGHKVGSWIPQTKHLKKKHVGNEWIKLNIGISDPVSVLSVGDNFYV